ncbi:MAG: glycosyltransferase, partial [Thermoleophilaceae bacterium]
TGVRDGVCVVGARRPRILAEALRHDVVAAPWIQPFLIPMLLARGVVLVPDLYDPAELELASGDGDVDSPELRSLTRLTELQLRFADFIICGSRRQRDHLLRKLERGSTARGAAPVVPVPFGLPSPPPPRNGHPLRELAGLARDDFVILWWGTIWRWFDPATAIEAVASLASRRPNIRLVFSAGPPPDPGSHALVKTEEARAIASSSGALGASTLFLDRWLPYEDRYRYLQDADLGITLHAENEEAELAVRARYLDYLWCALPCVLSAGDELAEQLAETGLATLVPPRDVEATAAALERRIDDIEGRAAAARHAQDLTQRLQWAEVVKPFARAVDEAVRVRRQRRFAAGLRSLWPVTTFYLQRTRAALPSSAWSSKP